MCTNMIELVHGYITDERKIIYFIERLKIHMYAYIYSLEEANAYVFRETNWGDLGNRKLFVREMCVRLWEISNGYLGELIGELSIEHF